MGDDVLTLKCKDCLKWFQADNKRFKYCPKCRGIRKAEDTQDSSRENNPNGIGEGRKKPIPWTPPPRPVLATDTAQRAYDRAVDERLFGDERPVTRLYKPGDAGFAELAALYGSPVVMPGQGKKEGRREQV